MTAPDMESTDPTCLQCGESRAVVKANGYFCAIVDSYDGECTEDWDKHRWADWSDKALRSYGVQSEHFHHYRRTPIHELQFIDCTHTDRAHVYNTENNDMLPPDYICLRCWADSRGEQP